MDKRKIIIVGGVAGGASAAARLRRLDEKAEIILFERGEHISFANCGLPYYVGEVIKRKENLLIQTPEGMSRRFNIDIRVNSEVVEINLSKKQVEVLNLVTKERYCESFDKLILSPGAGPIKPSIPGIDKANVFTLRNIPDTYAIKDYIDEEKPASVIVVGGGFIGLEMVENLCCRNIKVSIVEMANQVMAPLDYEMAAFLHEHMKANSVDLYLEDSATSFDRDGKHTVVNLKSGKQLKTDMVILAIGVRPETSLARKAGLEIGECGGIKVNQYLQTSHPDIYAIGDAIEVLDFVNGRPTLIPLAGPANKQGRIAANNICGIKDTYKATQGTAIVKVFEMTAACTGNNEKTLKRHGIPYMKSYTHSASHAGYYPGAAPMAIKLLFSPKDGKILGAQIVGSQGVDKRIDVLATAMRANLTVYDLQELELAYAPPYSSAKDAVNMSGYVASNILKGIHPVIHWDELDGLDPEKFILLDVRTKEENMRGAIPNSVNIPLDLLRERMDGLPKEREIIIYCQVGLRGYLAARILMQHGFNKVRNLSGGYRTYQAAKQGK
ncbi:MAG: pyridine nucleotide-disulfide oxidoreductase family protein [Firmicutes bacterium]|nr:pyridine nucleotide-disulfide oxidoreductase family protein [Bacillota bacterium]